MTAPTHHIEIDDKLVARFWKFVQKGDGCWLWTAYTNPQGYGCIQTFVDGKRKHVRAHRLSYVIANGPITDGMQVCHTCDVPSCVNPAHLWLGSNMDNVLDRIAKGRSNHKNGRVTHCKYGHEIDETVTYTGAVRRRCRACRARADRIAYFDSKHREPFTIQGVPVSGKNHMRPMVNRKTGKRFMKIGKVAEAWQVEAIRQLAEQRLARRLKTMDGPLYVEYVAYQPWDRCDIDNMESALFDALKKALVIRDDSLIQDHRGRKAVDADNPRFEIFISPLSE